MSLINSLLMKQVMEQYFLSLKGKRPMKGNLDMGNVGGIENCLGVILIADGSGFIDLMGGSLDNLGDLTVLGNCVISGTTNLADTATIENAIPSGNNSYDLGQAFKRFRTIYSYAVDIFTQVKTNTIVERTSGSGVTIDSLLIKDEGLPSAGDIVLSSSKILNAINGILRLPDSRPGLPSAGDVRYDPTTDTFEIYDGLSWNPH